MSGDAAVLVPVLREHGVRLAIENHPERTPGEVLQKIEAAARPDDMLGATVDTGWWATQGYDPARAIEELAPHVLHVHLKDVLAVGEPHDTTAWAAASSTSRPACGAPRRRLRRRVLGGA